MTDGSQKKEERGKEKMQEEMEHGKGKQKTSKKGDHALEAASLIFHSSKHIFCQWHLKKDVIKHAVGLKSEIRESTISKFSQLFHISEEKEFEDQANRLLTSIGENPFQSYLKKLLKKKEKWGGPWVNKLMTMGIRSTQLVEISNAEIKKFVRASGSIQETINAVRRVSESKVYFYSF